MARTDWQKGFGRRTGVALALAFIWCAAAAHGQCQYEVVTFQAPPCGVAGPPGISPTGINNYGHVCGFYNQCLSGEEAFLWLGPGQFITLPRPPGVTSARASDVNDNGVVTGTMQVHFPPNVEKARAFIWQQGAGGGQMQELGLLPGADTSEAFSINNKSQITGYSFNVVTGNPPFRAYIWEKGVMTDLQLPMGPHNRGNAINEAGTITGWMGSVFSHVGFRWTKGNVEVFGPIPGGTTAAGNAISNTGLVAGQGLVRSGQSSVLHALLWDGGSVIDLGLLPGAQTSVANDVNDFGIVVGHSGPAFVYLNGQMFDLNDVSKNQAVVLDGASAINNWGQIASSVVGPTAARVTPLKLHSADITADCVVNVDDLLAVIQAWGQVKVAADVSGDGVVAVDDLLMVINEWTG